MPQLKLSVTPEFDRDLRQFMKRRRIARPVDAIRVALREAVSHSDASRDYDFRAWLGMGLKAPQRRRRRFQSEDDL